MIRSAAAFLVMALALGWTGRGHDDSFSAQMVPITLTDSGGRTLLVSRYEVTVASWRQCYQDGGCGHMPESPMGSDNVPITGVNYIDVSKYLDWANARSSRALRLPTIAEWHAINPSPVGGEPQLRFTDPRMAWAATYGQKNHQPGRPGQAARSRPRHPASPILMAMCGSGRQAVSSPDLKVRPRIVARPLWRLVNTRPSSPCLYAIRPRVAARWERRQPILGLDWYRTSKFRIAMPAGNKNSGDRSTQVYWVA